MANQWFRLYGEFATDPKVQMLSEVDQRRYIMLLCLKCSNADVTLHETEIAFQLRISNEELRKTQSVLMSKKLINEDYSPTAWDKRQYLSDSSAARVARHREKKKLGCNVTVTPPDTDTDTDTEIVKKIKKQTEPSEKALLAQYGIEGLLATDFIIHRKAKRSKITRTVLEGFLSEAKKAGMTIDDAIRLSIQRNWQGFNSEWVTGARDAKDFRVSASTRQVGSRDHGQRISAHLDKLIAQEFGQGVDIGAV